LTRSLITIKPFFNTR